MHLYCWVSCKQITIMPAKATARPASAAPPNFKAIAKLQYEPSIEQTVSILNAALTKAGYTSPASNSKWEGSAGADAAKEFVHAVQAATEHLDVLYQKFGYDSAFGWSPAAAQTAMMVFGSGVGVTLARTLRAFSSPELLEACKRTCEASNDVKTLDEWRAFSHVLQRALLMLLTFTNLEMNRRPGASPAANLWPHYWAGLLKEGLLKSLVSLPPTGSIKLRLQNGGACV